jgi:hypothetical protein
MLAAMGRTKTLSGTSVPFGYTTVRIEREFFDHTGKFVTGNRGSSHSRTDGHV